MFTKILIAKTFDRSRKLSNNVGDCLQGYRVHLEWPNPSNPRIMLRTKPTATADVDFGIIGRKSHQTNHRLVYDYAMSFNHA